MYDRLLRAAEAEQPLSQDHPAPQTHALNDPLSVFGPLPPGTLFETRWGRVDAATAAFFLEEGEEVRPCVTRSEGNVKGGRGRAADSAPVPGYWDE